MQKATVEEVPDEESDQEEQDTEAQIPIPELPPLKDDYFEACTEDLLLLDKTVQHHGDLN